MIELTLKLRIKILLQLSVGEYIIKFSDSILEVKCFYLYYKENVILLFTLYFFIENVL